MSTLPLPSLHCMRQPLQNSVRPATDDSNHHNNVLRFTTNRTTQSLGPISITQATMVHGKDKGRRPTQLAANLRGCFTWSHIHITHPVIYTFKGQIASYSSHQMIKPHEDFNSHTIFSLYPHTLLHAHIRQRLPKPVKISLSLLFM